MVGILVSFWDGLFSGAMLVLLRAHRKARFFWVPQTWPFFQDTLCDKAGVTSTQQVRWPYQQEIGSW